MNITDLMSQLSTSFSRYNPVFFCAYMETTSQNIFFGKKGIDYVTNLCKNSIKFHNFKSHSYQEQTEGRAR